MDNASNPAAAPVRTPKLYDLMAVVLNDPELKWEQKKVLIDELRKSSPTTSDRWTYRYAIWFLGSAVVITIAKPNPQAP
jgi:hypothetical protein